MNKSNVTGPGLEAEGNRQDEKEKSVQALTEALRDAVVHLIGAASAYRTFAKRHASQGKAETDAMFSTRAADFDKAAERGRAALSSPSLALQPVEPPTLPFRGFVRHAPSADAPRVTNFAAAPPATVPAQPADRAEPAPLTDAQIEALWDQTFDQPLPLPDKSTIRAKLRRRLFARAILAAGKP